MAYRIEQSAESISDFFGILEYLTETISAPATARRFSDELDACYNRLLNYPLIYQVCRDEALAAKGFRFASVMRYIVFYTVDEEREIVRIHRILHGMMDYATN
jgi:plasmid stabilization system protein ParE